MRREVRRVPTAGASDSYKMDIRNSARIDWMYPNIYPDKGRLDSITINLMHVRASDAIQIEFDGDRNGYVIRMDKTARDECGFYPVEEKVEVAFIPAWNECAGASDSERRMK